jgi:phosphoribosylaminoimidazolecarboxamide formyltransferase/IMP cyclohydrolase
VPSSPPEGLVRIRRALFSVSDPRELSALARSLVGHSVDLVATEGTRRRLASEAIPARPAEELTGIGSWFGGRLKTLHPGLLGGILAPRTPDGQHELDERRLEPIDLVVVNFYPFAEHAARTANVAELTEFIDVGGVTLARAAAKNFAAVVVATDPEDYPEIQREVEAHDGGVTLETRRSLAARAFRRTGEYDGRIQLALAGSGIPSPDRFPAELVFRRSELALRYGENPHQSAAVFASTGSTGLFAPVPLDQLQGLPLSYTNLVDLDAALGVVAEFPTPTAAVVKHASPCGVASGKDLREAIARAVATDPVARYGCIIAVNRPLTADAFEPLHGIFVDLVAAPGTDEGARAAASRRRKLKVVRAAVPSLATPGWEFRSALGRLLVQEADHRQLAPDDFRRVTSRAASPTELCALDFAWRVVRHAKSNAIVLAQGSETVGIGSGQPTRVKAVQLALEVAGERARGSVLASDAFFPFADGVDAAGQAGVRAILQPGGSVRDAEVLQAAERHGIAMYLTGWRVFRH